VLTLLCLSGCFNRTTIEHRTMKLESTLQENHENARSCAPVQLGKAEASIAFSRYESEHGNALAAKSHLETATRLVAVVMQKSHGAACEGDRDGDGIADTMDRCPDIPEDFDGEADKDGCPDYDRDGDGVADDRDRCPNDKEDKDKFEDNDGCPEFDNDKDGLMDTSDQCPNEKEDFDNFRDLDGCPDPDNDGDGIPDVADKCPNQPGPASSQGCRDQFKFVLVRKDRIDLKTPVQFKLRTTKLIGRSHAILNEVATALKAMPKVAVRIEAHTDDDGPAGDNQTLSQKQAEVVRKYLIKRGISGKRLAAVGQGEDRPIDDNDSDEGRAANRRIEIHLVK